MREEGGVKGAKYSYYGRLAFEAPQCEKSLLFALSIQINFSSPLCTPYCREAALHGKVSHDAISNVLHNFFLSLFSARILSESTEVVNFLAYSLN